MGAAILLEKMIRDFAMALRKFEWHADCFFFGPTMNLTLSVPPCAGDRKVLRGFTLIELLVVIGIIAVLAALLFPLGQRALGSAGRTEDASNLRSIATAVQTYVSDHGILPGRVNRGIAIPSGVADGDRAKWLSTFLEDAGVVPFHSPMWESPRDYGVNQAGIAYILNNTIRSEPPNFFGRRSNTASNISQPRPLAGLFANVADEPDEQGALSKIWLATNADGDNYGSSSTGGSDYAISNELETPWGGRNYVFFDGHVEFRKTGDYPSHD